MNVRALTTFSLVALLAVGVLSLASPTLTAAPPPTPLADHLPAGTLAYIGWAGKTKNFDDSMIGQLLADPQLAKIINSIPSAVIRNSPDERTPAAIFKEALPMLDMAWRHQAAAALLDVEVGKGDPKPTGVFLLDLGKDREAFDQHLQELLKLLPKPPEEQLIGKVKYHTIPAGGGMQVAFGYIGDIFFVGAGVEVAQKLVTVLPDKSLATSEGFGKCIQAVGGADQQAVFFADVAQAYSLVDKLFPAPPPAAEGDKTKAEPNPFRHVLDVLGLNKVTAVAGTLRVVDRGMYTKCKIFVPAPFEGLLSPFNAKPLTDADFAKLPADADFAGVMRFSAGDFLQTIRKAVNKHGPFTAKIFEDGLTELREETGFDIESDFLANLGDTWGYSSAVSQGGFLTGSVLMVKVKDAEKLTASINKLEQYLDKKCGELGESRSPFGPKWKPSVKMDTTRYGKTDVHFLSSGMLMLVAPAWAIQDDMLYLAAWPQVIGSTVANDERKPLTQSKEFQALRKKLTDKPLALFYENTPNVMKQLYGGLLVYGTMGASALKQFAGIDASPAIIPTLQSVMKFFGPSASAVSADEGGIIFESYGSAPMGGVVMTSVSNTALCAAILLPSLQHALTSARTAASTGNLNSIGKSIMMYANTHDDDSPPDFNALVADGMGPKILVSPISGREDYVYIRLGNTSKIPDTSFIMAYERPENYRNEFALVLYADCHVGRSNMAQFQKDLKATMDYVKENKIEQPAAKAPATKVLAAKTTTATATPKMTPVKTPPVK